MIKLSQLLKEIKVEKPIRFKNNQHLFDYLKEDVEYELISLILEKEKLSLMGEDDQVYMYFSDDVDYDESKILGVTIEINGGEDTLLLSLDPENTDTHMFSTNEENWNFINFRGNKIYYNFCE